MDSGEVCPLCTRPNFYPSDHHLVPRCRGGKDKVPVCRDCHSAVHAFFNNKELEREYSTVEALMGHEGFRKAIAFIARQDPTRRVRTKLPKVQRHRGRNG